MTAFTEDYIQSLKPQKENVEILERCSDPGFGIRVTPKGRKTFFVVYFHKGRRCLMNLGDYPDNSLETARRKCRKARSILENGRDWVFQAASGTYS
jgi:hypothetical protein